MSHLNKEYVAYFAGFNSFGNNCSHPPQPVRKSIRRSVILRLEPLEDRITPATLTVTSTNDSGFGTLRAEVGFRNGSMRAVDCLIRGAHFESGS
jgi:hypothetical protein